MSCSCRKKTMDTPAASTPPQTPARSGACPFCLRKHLLAARGYAREVADDPSREWELEHLLENLLLAEDHADAIGEPTLRAAIRGARHAVEDGSSPLPAVPALLDLFRASPAWTRRDSF